MTLPSELSGFDGATCDCRVRNTRLELKLLRSASGHYLGYLCPHCGPWSRETGYYISRNIAKMELLFAQNGGIPLDARVTDGMGEAEESND